MKKFTFLIFFVGLFTVSACSGNSGTKAATKENTEGEVVQLTGESFQKLIWDYKKNPNDWSFAGDQPCIIDFYADWCGPCKMVAPILEELSAEYAGKVNIYKIDTEAEQELAGVFGIRSIPSMLFCPVYGQPQMAVGALPKDSLIKAIDDVLLNKPAN